MNEGIKKDWLAALRSDEYKQGQEVLCRVGKGGDLSYCCLGVLTDLAVKAGVIEPGVPEPNNTRGYGRGRESLVLPTEVQAWAGLTDNNPDVPYAIEDRDGTRSLAELNDDGTSFAEIADLIEAHL